MKTYTIFQPRTLTAQQAGMVSLVITAILMVVISITVLSFSQIVRREQRQALDNQLSSQAFYAAESGVNAAWSVIQSKYLANELYPPDKSHCIGDDTSGDYNIDGTGPLAKNILNPSTSTKYSCVLVIANPKSLSYDLTTTGGSKAFPIKTVDGSNIDHLSLSWTPQTGPSDAACTAGTSGLPAAGSWDCPFGMIRIDLVPITSLDRSDLQANAFTAFITPANGSITPDVGGSAAVPFYTSSPNINSGSGGGVVPGGTPAIGSLVNQGARPVAACDSGTCSIQITGLDANSYYARVSTIYRNTKLTVVAQNAAGTALSLNGAQALVDATGRSQDVLRRIQVHVPLTSTSLYGDYGLESTDGICKQFTSFLGYNYTGLESC